jgi:phytoene dehydrogenase-like protein
VPVAPDPMTLHPLPDHPRGWTHPDGIVRMLVMPAPVLGGPHDAIVVGGGHKGLTAAAYLARAGLDVCLLERRDVLGGACVTEELRRSPAGRRCSSTTTRRLPAPRSRDARGAMPRPTGLRRAARAGRGVRPPAAAAPAADARRRRSRRAGRPRAPRRAGCPAAPAPAPRARAPDDHVGRRPGRRVVRGRRAQGLPRLDRRVGVWAGPRTPGTAYNLLHHALGEIDGRRGAWGHVRGGMGAISLAIARSAQAAGATIRTGAPVASIDVADGAVTGVTLADGDGWVTTMFTQYGPHGADGWPDGSRERYLRACLDALERVAPGAGDAVAHAEVLAPPTSSASSACAEGRSSRVSRIWPSSGRCARRLRWPATRRR